MATTRKTTKTAKTTPSAPTATPAKPYRDAEGFLDLIKSARKVARRGTDYGLTVSLITHLAWKTPDATVSWAKNTTPTVPELADSMGLPTGTFIDQAMDTAATSLSEQAATEEQTKVAKQLTDMIKEHTATAATAT